MWAVAIVVTAVCGCPFTDVAEEDSLELAWHECIGDEEVNSISDWRSPRLGHSTLKKEWLDKLLQTIGDSGMELLFHCLSYDPQQRIHGGEAVDHPFVPDVAFPFLGVEHGKMPEPSDGSGGHGRKLDALFTPDTTLEVVPMTGISHGQTLFPGNRHYFGIRAINLEPALRHWLQRDDAWIAGTQANELLLVNDVNNAILRDIKRMAVLILFRT